VIADLDNTGDAGILFTIYDGSLCRFKVFAEAPRMVSYLAFGR
jgi:hypothetical protein